MGQTVASGSASASSHAVDHGLRAAGVGAPRLVTIVRGIVVKEHAGALRARRRAMAYPMPARRLTPVTTATRPRSGSGSARS